MCGEISVSIIIIYVVMCMKACEGSGMRLQSYSELWDRCIDWPWMNPCKGHWKSTKGQLSSHFRPITLTHVSNNRPRSARGNLLYFNIRHAVWLKLKRTRRIVFFLVHLKNLSIMLIFSLEMYRYPHIRWHLRATGSLTVMQLTVL